MKEYNVFISKRALKSLSKIPKLYRKEIAGNIDRLSNNPRPSGAKKISGRKKLFRIRVSDYRILYEIFDKEIFVVIIDVGHRKDIYSVLKKL